MFLLRFAVLALIVAVSRSYHITNSNQAMMYLSRFGYMSSTFSNNQLSQSSVLLSKAIQDFQAFIGLDVTGELNQATLKMMNAPRCGVQDKFGNSMSSRSKRYLIQGSRWRVKHLTYKIFKYPSSLSQAETDKAVREAFDVWAAVTPLSFSEKKFGPVHIEIWFVRGEHGCNDPFDGPSNTLAHAYYPSYGGDAHFDDAEEWTVDYNRGTDLFQVAVHEFGHSLGLNHSEVQGAVMYPIYRYNSNFQLHDDDIEGIQVLYGRRERPRPDPGNRHDKFPPPDEEGEGSDLCNGATIDTVFHSPDGNTYIFKGLYYWKLTDGSLEQGYPRLISNNWIGLPGNIDAAFFDNMGGRTFFFKGSKYWQYAEHVKEDEGYISTGFPGIPNNLDAAMICTNEKVIYFLKDSQYWQYSYQYASNKTPVQGVYPISNWIGIPSSVEAVLHEYDYTYFFKGGMFWKKSNEDIKKGNSGSIFQMPAFPLPSNHIMFGCEPERRWYG